MRTVGRAVKGAVTGAVGTLAIDLVWYSRFRRDGGQDSFPSWEFATSSASFDEAPAPGQATKKIADTVGVDLPDRAAGLATNVMHWLTGVSYGIGHALLRDGHPTLRSGIATGAVAFTNSYATLGAMGIYEPIWTYDRDTLLKDLSAHLVFGTATGVAYRALSSDRGAS